MEQRCHSRLVGKRGKQVLEDNPKRQDSNKIVNKLKQNENNKEYILNWVKENISVIIFFPITIVVWLLMTIYRLIIIAIVGPCHRHD